MKLGWDRHGRKGMRWGTMGWDRMGKKGGEVEWKGDRTIEEREREREREKRHSVEKIIITSTREWHHIIPSFDILQTVVETTIEVVTYT